MTGVIVVTVIATLIVNEFTDMCPWLADKLVRWSAYRRYPDRNRAETRAEELAALIRARPANLLKLITALGFAGTAAISRTSQRLPAASPRTNGLVPLSDVPAGLSVVSAEPEIDLANKDFLHSALLAAAADSTVIVFDMSATRFCCSRGATMLERASQRLAQDGGELRLVITDPRVQRVLAILGLDQVLSIFPSLAEAVSNTRATSPASSKRIDG